MSEPQRPQPQNTIQAAGHVASEVINGLKQQPILLGIILLNIVTIGAATWFLSSVMAHGQERFMAILKECLK